MGIANLFKKSTSTDSQEASVSTLSADAETEANEAETTASEGIEAEASAGENNAESNEPEANESEAGEAEAGESEPEEDKDGEQEENQDSSESVIGTIINPNVELTDELKAQIAEIQADENLSDEEKLEKIKELIENASESAGDDESDDNDAESSDENDSDSNEDEELPELDDLDGTEQLPELNLLGIEAVLDEEKLAELEEFKAKLESAIAENASVIANTHWTLQGIAQLFDVSKELWAFYGNQISANNSVIKAYAELKAQLASVQDFYSTALESVARLHKTAIRLYNECESALDEAQSLALKVSTDLSDTKSTLSQIQNLLDKLGDFEDTKTELETLLNSADEAKTNLTNLVSTLITEAKAELLASKESYESELESKHKEFLESLTSRLSDLESKASEITATLENTQLAYISALESKQSEINTELESKYNEYLSGLESKYNELLESLKAAAGDSSTGESPSDENQGEQEDSEEEEAEPTSSYEALVAFMQKEMQMSEEVAQNYITALKVDMSSDDDQLLAYFQNMLNTAEGYGITDDDLSDFTESLRAGYASSKVAADSSLLDKDSDYQTGYEAFLASTLYVKYLVSNQIAYYIQAGTYTEEQITEAKADAIALILQQYQVELDFSAFCQTYFSMSAEQAEVLANYLTEQGESTEEAKNEFLGMLQQAQAYGITDDDLSDFTEDLLKAAGQALTKEICADDSEEVQEVYALLFGSLAYVKIGIALLVALSIGTDPEKYTDEQLATAKANQITNMLASFQAYAASVNTLTLSTTDSSTKEQAKEAILAPLKQIFSKASTQSTTES